jgi:hypothetical protein
MMWMSDPFADPRTEGYHAAKACLGDLEVVGVLSIWVLQGALQISAYEIGHGIYLSVYLSTGAAIRYGIALGLRDDPLPQGHRPITNGELEEKRRATWVTLRLDR